MQISHDVSWFYMILLHLQYFTWCQPRSSWAQHGPQWFPSFHHVPCHGQEAFAQFTGIVSTSAWADLGISFLLSTWQHSVGEKGGILMCQEGKKGKCSTTLYYTLLIFNKYFTNKYFTNTFLMMIFWMIFLKSVTALHRWGVAGVEVSIEPRLTFDLQAGDRWGSLGIAGVCVVLVLDRLDRLDRLISRMIPLPTLYQSYQSYLAKLSIWLDAARQLSKAMS